MRSKDQMGQIPVRTGPYRFGPVWSVRPDHCAVGTDHTIFRTFLKPVNFISKLI